MKIDIRLEDDGAPVLFFPDDVNERKKTIMVYSRIGQHSEASRAYMRACRKPQTAEDVARCIDLLREWCRL